MLPATERTSFVCPKLLIEPGSATKFSSTMSGQRAPPRSNAEKLSRCIRYITGDGGFRSFSNFLSVLLDDPSHADQTVTQTVSRFFDEKNLAPFLDKVSAHRLMRGGSDMHGVVPCHSFCPGDPRREGTSATPINHVYVLLMDFSETIGAPFHGQGIILHWALNLIFKEVDKEAESLIKPRSSFHSPDKWTWDSLQDFSLQSQHDVAIQDSPIIWSILTTVAISRDQ